MTVLVPVTADPLMSRSFFLSSSWAPPPGVGGPAPFCISTQSQGVVLVSMYSSPSSICKIVPTCVSSVLTPAADDDCARGGAARVALRRHRIG